MSRRRYRKGPGSQQPITRNIRTHHAEDGSGVGSAIIAGKYESAQYRSSSDHDLAMTKTRKDAGLYIDL